VIRSLAPGYFLRFEVDPDSKHQLGGEHELAGATCRNCRLPLILHLTLDTSDYRLQLQRLGIKKLSLLYCMRCALCWYDFAYRLESDERIEILECFEGELMPEWYKLGIGDSLESRTVYLLPVPDHVQTLYDRLNANLPITRDDEHSIAVVTGSFARPEVGGYPIVDITNQLCGRAFLQQRLDSPNCPQCGELMHFLASLKNDNKQGLRITYDDVQIVFSLCTRCVVIHVQSSA
jgi:hypothetical protein